MRQTTTGTVAANIRAELARSRKTQSDLAGALGLSITAVSRRLRGETPFDVNELSTAADLLGVSESTLLAQSTAQVGAA